MSPVTVRDMLDPITPDTLSLFFLIGLTLGAGFFRRLGMRPWMAPMGLVLTGATFFLPYALLRNLQGEVAWSHQLGAFVLWLALCVGVYAGAYGKR